MRSEFRSDGDVGSSVCHCSGITFADRHGSIDSFLPFRFVSCPSTFHVHFDSQGTSYIRLWSEQIRDFLWDTNLSFTEKAAFTFAHSKKPLRESHHEHPLQHSKHPQKSSKRSTSWNWKCTPVAAHRSFTGLNKATVWSLR